MRSAPRYVEFSAGFLGRSGMSAVYDVANQLAGAAVPASALEPLVLPGRLGLAMRARIANRDRGPGLMRHLRGYARRGQVQ